MAEEQNTENEQTPAEAGARDAPGTGPSQARATPAEPEVVLAPKERRQRARLARAAKAGPGATRTPEERQAQRDAERAQKAAARRLERQQARAKHRQGAHERSETPAREHVAGVQKTRQGIVVSDQATKTITVRIDVARRHRRYQKIVRTSNTLHAHDERGEAHIGDTVIVRECRPLS